MIESSKGICQSLWMQNCHSSQSPLNLRKDELDLERVFWFFTLIVLAGNPGGGTSAMGTSNDLAQRSRSLPDHSALSIIKYLEISTNQESGAKPTFDLDWRSISCRFHDSTQEHRDVGDVASFENGRRLFKK